jgi:DNA topoisomerase IA
MAEIDMVLASDEDREGEANVRTLQSSWIPQKRTKRIVLMRLLKVLNQKSNR